MNVEMLQIPSFITIIIALGSLLVMPVTAMALSKIPAEESGKNAVATNGSACDLPPNVEIEGKGVALPNNELPPMDRRTADKIKTATFAMG